MGWKLLLLVLMLLELLDIAVAMGGLSTVAPLFTPWNDGNDANSGGMPGQYAVCVLLAGSLSPTCVGIDRNNDTHPPANVSLLGFNAGDTFVCGLQYATRFPICWGNRRDSNSTVPDLFRGVSYSSMSVGGFHVCALTSQGAVNCWGANDTNQASPPTNIRFFSIACGQSYCCGLNREGGVTCWGAEVLTSTTPSTSSFSSIFAGAFHACGIEMDTQKTICWGDNKYFQSTPPQGYNFNMLALGYYHSCGLLSDNLKVKCWGDDRFSQVSSVPLDEAFSSITAADMYTCGVSLKDLQTIKCWGNSHTNFSLLASMKVSQGLCSTGPCGNQMYQLNTSTSQRCPGAGESMCLSCPLQCDAIQQSTIGKCICTRPKGKKASPFLGVILGTVAGSVLFLIVVVTAAWYTLHGPKSKTKLLHNPAEWQPLVRFSRSEMRLATKNFHEDMIVGRGAQGVVYKGVLSDGRVVAIKTAGATLDNKLFIRELEILGRLHHSCLVSLIGYCKEDNFLVFEFMVNGSLADCLSRDFSSLSFITRLKIATQAARGLEYLHNYASPSIIHRDVKAANILLDNNWNAHVSDFGLSIFGPQTATHFSTMTVVGTPGYLDPNYLTTQRLTIKSDVYSFGVVLLQLLTGKKAVEVHDQLEMGQLSIVSQFNPQEVIEQAAVDKVFKLAMACKHENPQSRPSMSLVATILEDTWSNLEKAAADSLHNGSDREISVSLDGR